MPSPRPEGWKPLQVYPPPKHPPLFYRYDVTSNHGLSLVLTDLVTLWQCHLSKSELIASAISQHTSIDPSSKDQLDVLTIKLSQSLAGASNLVAYDHGSSDEELLLRTELSLPRPLQPLIFTFELTTTTSSIFCGTIFRPTLSALSTCKSQVDSLQDEIKAKDHVITKLLDRIGNQSVDMSVIFPTLTGVAGRKGNVSIEDAKKRIKGMEVFDRDDWAKGFDGAGAKLEEVFELAKGAEMGVVDAKVERDWLQHLPGPEELERRAQRTSGGKPSLQRKESGPRRTSKNDDEIASEEDEFERQATPPSLRKKTATPEPRAQADSSASSSEEDVRLAKKQKIGGIKGLSKRSTPIQSASISKSVSPVPTRRKQKSPTPPKNDDASDATETASESDLDPSAPKRSQSRPKAVSSPDSSDWDVPAKTQAKSQAKPKIGALRSKTSSKSPDPNPASNASTPSRHLGRIEAKRSPRATDSPRPKSKPAEKSPPTTPHKLGRIGVKKKSESPTPVPRGDEDATASEDDDLDAPISARKPKRNTRSPEQPRRQSRKAESPKIKRKTATPEVEPSPQIEETEEEKQARRKAELDKKIASGPAKKKRRF